jgi:predicted lysophospholipase L1 biosynthesis ABC-type transport system permease subunit
MKGTRFQAVLLAVVLMLGASAFAANKGALQVNNTVSVNGKQLEAGDYSVTWDGAGPDVQLSIMKGKKLVAKTGAKLVSMDKAPTGDQAIIVHNADGSTTLKEIRFGGKKYALAIGGSAQGTGSSGSSN